MGVLSWGKYYDKIAILFVHYRLTKKMHTKKYIIYIDTIYIELHTLRCTILKCNVCNAYLHWISGLIQFNNFKDFFMIKTSSHANKWSYV